MLCGQKKGAYYNSQPINVTVVDSVKLLNLRQHPALSNE